jgi:hypothetical protein
VDSDSECNFAIPLAWYYSQQMLSSYQFRTGNFLVDLYRSDVIVNDNCALNSFSARIENFEAESGSGFELRVNTSIKLKAESRTEHN